MDLSKLSELINECHERMHKEMSRVEWQNPKIYQNWLAQTSYLVNHTTRLICYATAHVPASDMHGFQYWLRHLDEEKNHEKLLVKDLSFFNLQYTDFIELTPTSMIYQNQYYWIQKAFPSTLLGYAFVMEGFAAKYGKFYLEIIEKAHGPKAVNFIRVHAGEDIKHFESGIHFLESLPPAEIKPLLQNMYQSELLYKTMLRDLSKEQSLAHLQAA